MKNHAGNMILYCFDASGPGKFTIRRTNEFQVVPINYKAELQHICVLSKT